MDLITPFLASVPNDEPDVIVLRCADPLHFDPTALNALCAKKGIEEAEEVVCRVLEDIAMRLDILQQGRDDSRFDLMFKPARRIGLVAGQIGLTEVSAAAGHVVICLQQMDGIALEATMARLERAFDVAISEIWNHRML
ncbi:MAG: hypothetical protein AAFP85_02545 [Pseudomonadota bacterium]